MSVETSISHAFNLNNKSCCFIKRGHYDEAVQHLIIALQIAKQFAIAAQPPQESSSKQARSAWSSRSRSAISDCSDDHQEEYEYLCQSELKFEATSTDSYIHRTPVFVDARKRDEDATLSHISFYVMFNLSLAYHLRALNEEDEVEAKKSLSVAKRLYELTLQMQVQDDSENSVITMAALLNNLSQVHNVLKNINEMRRYQELLLTALVILVDSGSPEFDASSSNGSSTALDGFMGNVMHLMIIESPVASAA
jgi:hypothetical protein